MTSEPGSVVPEKCVPVRIFPEQQARSRPVPDSRKEKRQASVPSSDRSEIHRPVATIIPVPDVASAVVVLAGDCPAERKLGLRIMDRGAAESDVGP